MTFCCFTGSYVAECGSDCYMRLSVSKVTVMSDPQNDGDIFLCWESEWGTCELLTSLRNHTTGQCRKHWHRPSLTQSVRQTGPWLDHHSRSQPDSQDDRLTDLHISQENKWWSPPRGTRWGHGERAKNTCPTHTHHFPSAGDVMGSQGGSKKSSVISSYCKLFSQLSVRDHVLDHVTWCFKSNLL